MFVLTQGRWSSLGDRDSLESGWVVVNVFVPTQGKWLGGGHV